MSTEIWRVVLVLGLVALAGFGLALVKGDGTLRFQPAIGNLSAFWLMGAVWFGSRTRLSRVASVMLGSFSSVLMLACFYATESAMGLVNSHIYADVAYYLGAGVLAGGASALFTTFVRRYWLVVIGALLAFEPVAWHLTPLAGQLLHGLALPQARRGSTQRADWDLVLGVEMVCGMLVVAWAALRLWTRRSLEA